MVLEHTFWISLPPTFFQNCKQIQNMFLLVGNLVLSVLCYLVYCTEIQILFYLVNIVHSQNCLQTFSIYVVSPPVYRTRTVPMHSEFVFFSYVQYFVPAWYVLYSVHLDLFILLQNLRILYRVGNICTFGIFTSNINSIL